MHGRTYLKGKHNFLLTLPEEIFIMAPQDSLKEQIAQAEVVLAESKENFEKNPDDYSARLLLMSMENHLADLLKKRDVEGEK